MADILLQFEPTAAIPIAIAPIKNVVIAMATIQSEIDRATTQNNFILAGYIFALLIAAAMTFLSWRAGNRVQDLVRRDADARIKEADSRAAEALENAGKANERAGIANEAAAKANASAAQANERAQKLENDNIQLRTDLETATAESRARQTELAKEQSNLTKAQRETAEAQRRAAEAQLALKTHVEAVARWQEDRRLSAPFPDKRKIDPDGHWGVSIGYKQGDDEAFRFARLIFGALLAAGWSISDDPYPVPVEPTVFRLGAPSIPPGVMLVASSGEAAQSRAMALGKAFEESGCPVSWGPARPDGQPLLIIVGSKPAFSN